MCVCICIYTYTCSCIHEYIYIYLCICIYIFTYMFICVYVYICIYLYICTNLYVYMCIYLYICTCPTLDRGMSRDTAEKEHTSCGVKRATTASQESCHPFELLPWTTDVNKSCQPPQHTIDWFWLRSWLIHNRAICTRIALLWQDTTGTLKAHVPPRTRL